MKNFTNPAGKTLKEDIPEEIPFQKIKDAFKLPFTPAKGDCEVLGYLKTKSTKFKAYSYSMYLNNKGIRCLINLPNWYGEQLDEDFTNSGLTAQEYFDNAFIKSIESVPTKAGNDTYIITIYED